MRMKMTKAPVLVSVMLIVIFVLVGCGGTSEEKSKETVKLDLSIEPRDGAVGKSDKNFTELTKSKPTSVRNDVTTKWRKITLADSVDITKYLLSYNNLYMTDDSTVHIIFNFTTNTTTMINAFEGYLDVRVHEYVKKEEHDVKTIGNGMLLCRYTIYKDNGDIVKVD